jgi:Ca2+-binding EF-hand superfamily protein
MFYEWEDKLRNFFMEEINSERKLTQLRLNLLSLISPQILFEYFDEHLSKNNYISTNDIIKLFPTLQDKINEIKTMIIMFDKDNDMVLNSKEFFTFLTPKFIDVDIQKICNVTNMEINEEILQKFSHILLEEINMISNLKNIILDIQNSKGFTIYESFILITNDKNEKSINEDMIKKFILKLNEDDDIIDNDNIKIYNEDISNFIFRFDKDSDFQLNYEEYSNIFNIFNNMINSKININQNENNINQNNKNKISNLSKEQTIKEFPIPEGHLYFNYSLEDFDTNSNGNINNSYDLSNHLKQNFLNTSVNLSMKNMQQNYKINLPEKQLLRIKFPPIEKLNEEKKNLLLDLFKTIVNTEVNTEKKKYLMSLNSQINLSDLFSLFDYSNEDAISTYDIYTVLKNYFNYESNMKNIKLLFLRYDKDKDEKLNYREFCEMILPKKIEFAKMIINHFPDENFIKFNDESNQIIFDVIKSLIDAEEEIYQFKIKMNSFQGFSIFECWELLKNKYENLINRTDIKHFLIENGVTIINDEMEFLMDYIKIITKSKGDLNFNDLVRLVNPHNPELIF